MNERKKSLNVNAFAVFIIVVVISIIIGLLIGLSINKGNNPSENTLGDSINTNSNECSKSYQYNYDLNGDGKNENINIEFSGIQNSSAQYSINYNKLNIIITDGQTSQKYSLVRENDDFFSNVCNPDASIVDISDTDSFKEIYISGTLGDSSPDYRMNVLIEYNGNEVKELKVNKYADGMVKTFDYVADPDSNYMMEGVYTNTKFGILDGVINFHSNSNKKVVYKLNENHELVLEQCIFDENEDYYTDILKSQLSVTSIKLYNAQNTNSTSKEVTEFNKVTKVDDHWLTVSLENGEVRICLHRRCSRRF